MVTDTIGQYHIACSELDQIFKMDIQGKCLVELLSTPSHKEKLVIRMSLAVQQDLFLGDDVPFLSVLFDSEVEDLIAERHRVREMSDLFPNNEDLEILRSIDGGGKTGAFLHYLLIEMSQFLLLTVTFLLGVEDGTDLYGFGRTGVSQFDVKCPFREVGSIYGTFIAKIGLFIHTDVILKHAGMQGTR